MECYKNHTLTTLVKREHDQTIHKFAKAPRNRETEASNVNKMAAFHSSCLPKDLLSSLSAEVLYIILSYLPAKSLLNVSECNRRLRDLCQNCNSLWKRLCKVSEDRCIDALDRKIMQAGHLHGIGSLVRNYLLLPLVNGKCKDLVFYLSFCMN